MHSFPFPLLGCTHSQSRLAASPSSDAEAPLTKTRWPLVLYTFILQLGASPAGDVGFPLTSPTWFGEQPPRLQKIGNDGKISVYREGVMRAPSDPSPLRGFHGFCESDQPVVRLHSLRRIHGAEQLVGDTPVHHLCEGIVHVHDLPM